MVYKLVNNVEVELTQEEIDLYAQSEIENDARIASDLILEYQVKRSSEYPSLDDLITALWEKVVDGDTTSADSLKLMRDNIKTKYPKPA